MLASMLRPDSLNLPLFVHVLGAMILVGGLLATSASVIVARGDVRLLRIGVHDAPVRLPAGLHRDARRRAVDLLARAPRRLPDDPAWIGIGFITADAGALLLLISLILGGLGLRRVRGGGGTGLLRASLIISVVLLAAYIVAIWAMGAKPA